ncbi:MAG: hypothetical protein HY738_02575 [Bacteroidia bacterium]|nr:hypothetical protein [Bacteroidia bacterium]
MYIPNLLLIAGSGQNTGKTAFACRVIEKFSKHFDIVALKISSRLHKTTQSDNVLHECENCIITLETYTDTGKDTSRMLKAGAKKVYYIQVKNNNILEAIENIGEIYDAHTPVICESGGLRKFIKPGLFIFMTTQQDFLKNSELAALADMRILTSDVNNPEYLARIRFSGGKWECC